MIVEQVKGTEEQLALVALCLDTEVLSRVVDALPEYPFAAKVSNLVYNWCRKHYAEYKEAPGAVSLTAIYAEWASTADEATSSLVGKFLSSLSPTQLNPDYAVSLIERLVVRHSAKQLADRVQAALSNGNVQAAWDLIQAAKPPQLAQDQCYVDPINDPSAISDAYHKANYEPLIRFTEGSAMSRWLGPTLHRDALVVLCGADKAGKSSHLASFCQRAMVQGNKVAYFNIGDLSQFQCMKRWSTALVGRPSFSCKFKIPTSIAYKSKEFTLEYQERVASSVYSEDEAIAAWGKLRTESGESRLRMVSKPARTMTVEDMKAILDTWANQGWVPDVIGIDYMALLGFSRGFDKQHEAFDHAWARLRALASEYKALVLTASQVNADAYQANTYWLNQSHFTGSKGIWSHCNAAIGLNITTTEREQQITRMNFIVLREREYLSDLPSSYLAVAGCPKIGRFHLISEFI
jgi:replicative DNA helicase